MLAVHDRSFVLKHSIRQTRLNFATVGRLLIGLTMIILNSVPINLPFEVHLYRAATLGHIFE